MGEQQELSKMSYNQTRYDHSIEMYSMSIKDTVVIIILVNGLF